MIKRYCSVASCKSMSIEGSYYCSKHKEEFKTPDNRPSARERGYTKEWENTSKEYLLKNPLCVNCLSNGKEVKATVTDHKLNAQGYPNLFWSESNWQSLCHSCHSIKTALERRERIERSNR